MPRKSIGHYNQKMIREIRKQMLDNLNKLEWVIEEMERTAIEDLEISGHAEMNRSIRYLFKFAQNAELALHDALMHRGDLGRDITSQEPVSDVSGSRKKSPKTRKKKQ